MIFQSPYPLTPPTDKSLPSFLFQPLSDPRFHPSTEPTGKTEEKRTLLTAPLFYPTPSPKTSRPKARPISLLELESKSRNFAYALLTGAAGGVDGGDGRPWEKGETLAIYSQNQHDYLAAVLGTLMAGGQVALCNPSYRPEELSRNLAMVGARAILASVASLERAQEAVEMNRRERQGEQEGEGRRERLGGEEEIGLFVFEEGHERSWEGLLLRKGERRAGDGARALERVVIHPLEDTAIVCFSSGTSGPPKAVELTHSNLVANVIQATFLLLDRMNEPLFDEGDWYAAGGSKKVVDAGSKLSSEFHIDVLPCFHCYGLLVSMVAIHTCTPRVVLPRFELELFLKSVQDHRITFCFVVPPILLALARSPLVEGYDISSLTRVASGAASLPSELCQEVRKRLGILSTDGYGMSEMSPIISMQNIKDLELAPGTVGVLAPGTEAKVVDPEGKELGPNEEGELLLRGPQMMKGYLNDQASNRKSFHPSFEDPERFLRTGDVVKMDERGYITITDRLKDVIKYHGFQVSPSELESLLFQDPRLADCAVCGVKNQVGEELPWAFVVLSSSSSSSARETTTAELDRTRRDLASLVNQRVAGYKKLRGVSFVEALPKSDSGKVLKKDLAGRADLDRDGLE